MQNYIPYETAIGNALEPNGDTLWHISVIWQRGQILHDIIHPF